MAPDLQSPRTKVEANTGWDACRPAVRITDDASWLSLMQRFLQRKALAKVAVLTWMWCDQLQGRFGARVPSAECKAGKPSPEPYLEGLRRLGLDAEMCIAFEDSPAGLVSPLTLPSDSTRRLALSAA